MNQFLAEYYGTGATSGNEDADALEKMAQLTLLTKEAEEEGVDLSGLSDDEVMQLAEELYGEGGEAEGEAEAEATGEEDMEKEAAAKFEEADFLGRVMAHSMWQELDNIQKEAGAGQWVKETAGKGYQAVKGALRRAHGATLGRVGEKAEEKAMTGTAKRIGAQKGRIDPQTKRRLRKGEFTESEAAKIMRRGRQANIAAQIGTGAAAAGTAGGLGYGGYRGVKALKEKKGSALDTLVEQRAMEHLAAAGYVDQQGNVYGPPEQEKTASDQDFNTIIDKAALELLEQNGYPINWRE